MKIHDDPQARLAQIDGYWHVITGDDEYGPFPSHELAALALEVGTYAD